MLDIIIKNGTIVNSDSSIQADVGIKDGKIVVIGRSSTFSEAERVIEAKNKYVMPGMIDSHVHVNQAMGEFTTLDTFKDASIAAAHGGTTTMIDFAIPAPGETPLQTMEDKMEQAKGNSLINYSLHGGITNGSQAAYQEVEDLITGGIPTIKMFTVYGDNMVNMAEIYEVLKIISKKGGMAKFHSESNDFIGNETEKHVSNNQKEPIYHALSRPPINEAESMASLISLIEDTGAPSLILHLSSDKTRSLLETYKTKLPIYTEMCPPYLILTEDVYKRPDGQNFICSPPIRPENIQQGLWKLIEDGYVDVINSDHCGFDTTQKAKNKNDFTRVPNGLPGVETRGIVFYSEGVAKEKISVNQFVNMTSTKVSKLMGMFPQKGIIGVGSDADIVVYDPNIEYELTIDGLHMNTDYSPFEGLGVTGKPSHTIVNGRVLVENGELLNENLRGEFIKRGQPLL